MPPKQESSPLFGPDGNAIEAPCEAPAFESLEAESRALISNALAGAILAVSKGAELGMCEQEAEEILAGAWLALEVAISYVDGERVKQLTDAMRAQAFTEETGIAPDAVAGEESES